MKIFNWIWIFRKNKIILDKIKNYAILFYKGKEEASNGEKRKKERYSYGIYANISSIRNDSEVKRKSNKRINNDFATCQEDDY